MASRYYLLNILVFVLLAGACITGVVLSRTALLHPAWGLVLVLVLIAVVIFFVRRMNTLNRQLASFMDSLRNQDTALGFSANSRSRMTRELKESFDLLMEALRDQKFEFAAREQLLLAMIENSTTGFISIDAHGDFELMNQAARSLLGTRFTSNMNRLSSELPALHELLMRLEDGGADTLTLPGAGGPTLVRVACTRMDFHRREFKLVSLQDIRREVDARELESWQKLIRILNHEIMNSIAPITSASRSLRSLFMEGEQAIGPEKVDPELIADTLDGLEIIETMGSGLRNFVENYRKLSRIPDPVPTLMDLEKWGHTLEKLASDLASGESAELKVQVDKGGESGEKIGHLLADEGLLNQVMLNLMRNAVEAPGPKGPGKPSQRQVEIWIAPVPSGKIRIRVRNNGDPIPPELAEQIFIPFFTTKEQGAGIGLFLARQIISMHRGTVDTYTAPDGFTVFEIII